jgi:hypothetical protein
MSFCERDNPEICIGIRGQYTDKINSSLQGIRSTDFPDFDIVFSSLLLILNSL